MKIIKEGIIEYLPYNLTKGSVVTSREQHKGCPNRAYIMKRSPNIILCLIDLATKYAVVEGFVNGIDIVLGFDENTIHRRMGNYRNKSTVISFPDSKGWEVWLAECSRYSVKVVLAKFKG